MHTSEKEETHTARVTMGLTFGSFKKTHTLAQRMEKIGTVTSQHSTRVLSVWASSSVLGPLV